MHKYAVVCGALGGLGRAPATLLSACSKSKHRKSSAFVGEPAGREGRDILVMWQT